MQHITSRLQGVYVNLSTFELHLYERKEGEAPPLKYSQYWSNSARKSGAITRQSYHKILHFTHSRNETPQTEYVAE